MHQWSTKSISKTTNPMWKEKRTLRVPLDREFKATFEVLDKNKTMFGGSAKSISMGQVTLEAEDLLTATTLDLGEQLTSGGEKVQGAFSKGWVFPRSFPVKPSLTSPDVDLGFLDIIIDAPPRLATMYSRIKEKVRIGMGGGGRGWGCV